MPNALLLTWEITLMISICKRHWPLRESRLKLAAKHIPVSRVATA